MVNMIESLASGIKRTTLAEAVSVGEASDHLTSSSLHDDT